MTDDLQTLRNAIECTFDSTPDGGQRTCYLAPNDEGGLWANENYESDPRTAVVILSKQNGVSWYGRINGKMYQVSRSKEDAQANPARVRSELCDALVTWAKDAVYPAAGLSCRESSIG